MTVTTTLGRGLRAVVSAWGGGSTSLIPTARSTWSGAAATTLFVGLGDEDWSANATAYRCVQAIATNAASLPLQVRDTEDTNVENHWLSALWANPNPLMSRRLVAELAWAKLEKDGETFIYIDRGDSGEGQPAALWPLFGTVTPIVDGDSTGRTPGEIVGYQVRTERGFVYGLLPAEVLWLRYPDPSTTWGALAPLHAIGDPLKLDAEARRWQLAEFKNGGKAKHVVYLGDLTPEQHDAAVQVWRSQVEGAANAGKSLLVSSDVIGKTERISMTPDEMSWMDTRKTTAEEIMLGTGVPRDYLMGGTTYENRRAAKVTLWSDTIVPKLEVVASEITRQLLDTEPGRRARFDTDDVDALRESEDSKFKRVTDIAPADVLTLDELREHLGFEALPGGLGNLTSTAYRAYIQLLAQQALLNGAQLSPGDLQRARTLRIPTGNTDAAPLLLPRAGDSIVHGPSLTAALAAYDRLEPPIYRAVGKLAARQESATITNLRRLFGEKSKAARAWLATTRALASAEDDTQLRTQADDLFPIDHWVRETVDGVSPSVGAAWDAGGSALAASLGIDFQAFELLVLTAMDSRLEVLAGQVTQTTRTILEDQILLQGVADGESIDQLAARVRGVFSNLRSWRATTIARTETVGGFNRASFVVAQHSNVVTGRQWMATDDDRVRDTHRDLDGEVVIGWQTSYANGCLHPGDPMGPAAETINCRCVELYLTPNEEISA